MAAGILPEEKTFEVGFEYDQAFQVQQLLPVLGLPTEAWGPSQFHLHFKGSYLDRAFLPQAAGMQASAQHVGLLRGHLSTSPRVTAPSFSD